MLAREGIREMTLATILLGAIIALAIWIFWPLAILPAIVLIWVFAFFRDPNRQRAYQPGELPSPADGTITEISHLDHHETIEGPAIRIGIFLSIFNVHINRSPCNGVISSIEYQPGKYLDARHPDSGTQNEANTIVLNPGEPYRGPVIVRQIAGKIARRIICHPENGATLQAGERFGLIKFGSRTELILPDDKNVEIPVSVGQTVKAGITILAIQKEDMHA